MNSVQNVGVTGTQIVTLFASLHLARHGNAPRIPDIEKHDPRNHNRSLSVKGHEQAHKIRQKLLGDTFDFVAASPLNRAQETTLIMTNGSPMNIIEALGWNQPTGPDWKESMDPLMQLFDEYMYRPLRDYFEDPRADHLKVWAFNALAGNVEKATELGEIDLRAFIGGHAICHEAIVWTIGEIFIRDGFRGGEQLQRRMLEMNSALGEAEVLNLTFNARGVSAFQVIKPE